MGRKTKGRVESKPISNRFFLRAGAGVTGESPAPSELGNQHADDRHAEKREYFHRRRNLCGKELYGNVRDQKHRHAEGKEGPEGASKGGVGQARDVEEIVVSPDDALRFDGEKANARQQEHEGVVYEYADAAKKPEADALTEAGRKLHFMAGVGHDRYAAKGADDGSRIDGSQ